MLGSMCQVWNLRTVSLRVLAIANYNGYVFLYLCILGYPDRNGDYCNGRYN